MLEGEIQICRRKHLKPLLLLEPVCETGPQPPAPQRGKRYLGLSFALTESPKGALGARSQASQGTEQ